MTLHQIQAYTYLLPQENLNKIDSKKKPIQLTLFSDLENTKMITREWVVRQLFSDLENTRIITREW